MKLGRSNIEAAAIQSLSWDCEERAAAIITDSYSKEEFN
jgi:hypothetical protein